MAKSRASKKRREYVPRGREIVCLHWPIMQGEPVVRDINGLPYTQAMLERRAARLAEEMNGQEVRVAASA